MFSSMAFCKEPSTLHLVPSLHFSRFLPCALYFNSYMVTIYSSLFPVHTKPISHWFFLASPIKIYFLLPFKFQVLHVPFSFYLQLLLFEHMLFLLSLRIGMNLNENDFLNFQIPTEFDQLPAWSRDSRNTEKKLIKRISWHRPMPQCPWPLETGIHSVRHTKLLPWQSGLLRLVDSDGAYSMKMAPVSLLMYFQGISSMFDNAGFNCSKLAWVCWNNKWGNFVFKDNGL